jgi:hypothetical protein
MRCVSLFLALVCNSAFASTWNAPTGNLSDVQNAVNSASHGDTVTIPAGTFVWNNTLKIHKSLIIKGQGMNSTFILRHMGHAKDLIVIKPTSDVPVRITGINFDAENIGQNYNQLVSVSVRGPQGGSWGLTQIRIDHCHFTGGVDAVEWNYYAYGVVDHCTFLDCPYAVVSYADGDSAWSRPIEFGTSNEDYIENCTFVMDSNLDYFDTLTDADFGGRMCMRHCKVNFRKFTAAYQFGSIWMMHGNQAYWTGNQEQDNVRGAITLELYDNTVVTNQAYRIIYLRGGQTVAYNNKFTFPNSNPPIASMTEEEGYDGPGTDEDWFNPLRTTWPAEDQVNNSFFWGNTVNGAAQSDGNFSDWNVPPDNIFIQEDRDYWTTPPSSSTATIYPSPGYPSSPSYPAKTYYAPVTSYKAFKYPHPLTTQGLTGGN